MNSIVTASHCARLAVRIAMVSVAAFFAGSARAGDAAHILEDTKIYFTAPLHWDATDWIYFAGSVASIGIAHHFDTDVRLHFVANDSALATIGQSHSLEDAAPAAVAFFGTWLIAGLSDDREGLHETWAMAEATALSATTGLLMKFAAGRERPYDTADPDNWRAGGDSFPSLHATAAFAIGTVLAESGNDEYRWLRRTLGYGIGVATSYQRLKHNQHWLSDTVAGAALGISSAHFAMNRREGRNEPARISVTPLDGGLLLAYAVPLH